MRRIEITSFVGQSAVPQLRDAEAVLQASLLLPGLKAQVLVPTLSQGLRAVGAGARFLVFVLSASDAHNLRNVRRTSRQSVEDYRRLISEIPSDTAIRLNLATAFDCPFEGQTPDDAVTALLDDLLAIRSDVEIGLCDTTGQVTPNRVAQLFDQCKRRFPELTSWAFHGHDTYGLGLANLRAAVETGVDVVDASFGGIGGCPFAPGATGNVATEDVVWMLERMGIETGIQIHLLLEVALEATKLPGAVPGGRVRDALLASTRRKEINP